MNHNDQPRPRMGTPRISVASVDVDSTITDDLILRAVSGIVPRLAQAVAAIPGVDRPVGSTSDAVDFSYTGPLRPIAENLLFSSFGVVLSRRGAAASTSEILDRLRESRGAGAISALSAAPITFRIGPLPSRWALRDAIVENLGWINSTNDWTVNISLAGEFLVAEIGPLFRSARFVQGARLPASTTPVIAAFLAQLAKIGDEDIVWDPFCGAGTILIEAARAATPRLLVGSDISRAALEMARQSLLDILPQDQAWALIRSSADHVPARPDSVDKIIANLPFGKRVGTHENNVDLYPAFLSRLADVLAPSGRAVLLTEDKKLFHAAVERTRGIKVVREYVLESGGLHPSAYLLTPTRATGGRSGGGARPRKARTRSGAPCRG